MVKKVFFIWVISIIALISLAANVYIFMQFVSMRDAYNNQKANAKVLDFRNMFSEKILLATGEVDFDTRLTLETAVRELKDQEIFNQWEKFTKCQTKEAATTEAKNLLKLLIKKTAYN